MAAPRKYETATSVTCPFVYADRTDVFGIVVAIEPGPTSDYVTFTYDDGRRTIEPATIVLRRTVVAGRVVYEYKNRNDGAYADTPLRDRALHVIAGIDVAITSGDYVAACVSPTGASYTRPAFAARVDEIHGRHVDVGTPYTSDPYACTCTADFGIAEYVVTVRVTAHARDHVTVVIAATRRDHAWTVATTTHEFRGGTNDIRATEPGTIGPYVFDFDVRSAIVRTIRDRFTTGDGFPDATRLIPVR